MRLRHHLNVLPHGFRLGFKQGMATKIDHFGAYLLYITIVVLYAGIIRNIPQADLDPLNLTHAQMIWYLATTEFVLFSVSSWGFKDVQNEHQSGEIHLALLRPYPDSLLRVSLWIGGSTFRTLVLAPIFAMTAFLCSGGVLPFTLGHVAGLVAGLPLAMLMLVIGAYIVGSSCLWFIQSEPAYWIWQKSNFLLGAMLWPMCFYPKWAQTFMWSTPFPAILGFAGDWTLSLPTTTYLGHFAHQLFWAALFLLALRKMDRIVLKHIQQGKN